MAAELAEVQRNLLLPASNFGPFELKRLESRAKELDRSTEKLRQQVKRDMSPSRSLSPNANKTRPLPSPIHSIAKMQRAPAPGNFDLNDRGCDLEDKSRRIRQTIRDNSPPQKRSTSPTQVGGLSGTVDAQNMAELNKLAREMTDIQKKLLNPRASEAEKKRLHAAGAICEDKKAKLGQEVKRALIPPPKPIPRLAEPTTTLKQDSPPRKGRPPSPNGNRSPSPQALGPQSWGKDEEELEGMGKELCGMQRKLLKKTNIIEQRALLAQINELEAAAVCLKQAVRGQTGKDYLNKKVGSLVGSASEMRRQVKKDIDAHEVAEAERRKKQDEQEAIKKKDQDLEAERQRKVNVDRESDEHHLMMQKAKRQAAKENEERKAREEKLKAGREAAADRAKLDRKRRLDEAAKKRAIEVVRLETEAEQRLRAQKRLAEEEIAKKQAVLEEARYKAEKEAEKFRIEELLKAGAEKARIEDHRLKEAQRAKIEEKKRLKAEQDRVQQEKDEKSAKREEDERRSKLAEAEEKRRQQKEVWRVAAEKAAKEKERDETEQRRRMERWAKKNADEKARAEEKEAKDAVYRKLEEEKKRCRAQRERDYKQKEHAACLAREEEIELRIINQARIKNNLENANRSLSPATTRKLSQRAMSVESEVASLTKEIYMLQQEYLAAKRGSPEKAMLKEQSHEIDQELAGAVVRHQRYLAWEKWNNRETSIGGQVRSGEWPEVTEDDLMVVIENWESKMRRREEREAMEQRRTPFGSPVKPLATSPSRAQSMTVQARSDFAEQRAFNLRRGAAAAS